MIPIAKPIINREMEDVVISVLRSKSFILGENVKEFEREFADYCGVRHGIGVGSGTEALRLALLAVGVGLGDEVITVPNTFIATAFAISSTGAKPVFVDIDDSYTMDPRLIEDKITPRTKAVIPVHLYGHTCDMHPINEVARDHGLSVIEDACQAHGAEYDGKRVGSLGDLACFSFYPSKNMTVAGDGGMITTGKEEFNDKIYLLRNYGQKTRNIHEVLGSNSRLSEISASIGRVQLRYLDGWNDARRRVAEKYKSELEGLVATPVEKWGKHVYHLYVVRTNDRQGLAGYLGDKGVSTAVHYPTLIYDQPCYGLEASCPVSMAYSKEILSLPMYPEITGGEIVEIVSAIKDWCGM